MDTVRFQHYSSPKPPSTALPTGLAVHLCALALPIPRQPSDLALPEVPSAAPACSHLHRQVALYEVPSQAVDLAVKWEVTPAGWSKLPDCWVRMPHEGWVALARQVKVQPQVVAPVVSA